MDVIDRINLRLKKLLEYIALLKEYQGITSKQLMEDPKTRGVVERYLQLACEVVLDVANLLNAEYRFRPPEDSRDSVVVLGEERVLDKTFADEFSNIAGFRNILVHDYIKIDYTKVADNLNNRLTDFEKFAQQVARFLAK